MEVKILWAKRFICVFTLPSLCTHLSLIVFPEKDTSQLGSTLMVSFQLHYLCKDPMFIHSHILRYWGSGLQHMRFGETQFLQ